MANSVWRVGFNTETCSMCEVCVRACPTHALFVRTKGNVETILFDSRLCDGCGGTLFCQEQCPEKAATVTRAPALAVSSEPVALIAGEMITCRSCGALFMPKRELETLLKNKKMRPNGVQGECPACRREHLLDSYLKITGQTF
jgi:ferredoxin